MTQQEASSPSFGGPTVTLSPASEMTARLPHGHPIMFANIQNGSGHCRRSAPDTAIPPGDTQ
jgi:hypothetical protein